MIVKKLKARDVMSRGCWAQEGLENFYLQFWMLKGVLESPLLNLRSVLRKTLAKDCVWSRL